MNRTLLLNKINSSNISKSDIAELLGLTRQGLYNKLSGKKDFKASEVKKLLTFFISQVKKETIFFCRLCRQLGLH